MAESDPTGRVLQLLSLLQTHRFWPGAELADRLRVSRRTLRRDIDRLRTLGYPVDATPGVEGGYRLAAGAHLPPLLLDDDEAVAIAVGLRATAGGPSDGADETALRALAKLEQVLPDRLRRRVAAVYTSTAVLRWGADEPPLDTEALGLLSLACRDHEEIRFDYVRRDGEESRRLVQPHRLVATGRTWYLVAFDVRRDDWRTFRVDRMTGTALAGVRFEPRPVPGGDAAEFVADAIRATPKEHEAVVRVGLPADELVAEARWLDDRTEPVDAGTCRVRLAADSADRLASMVGSLALHAPVGIEVADEEVRFRLGVLADRLADSDPG